MKPLQVSLDQMIQNLLNSKKYSSLRDMLIIMNPADIASLFQDLPVTSSSFISFHCQANQRILS